MSETKATTLSEAKAAHHQHVVVVELGKEDLMLAREKKQLYNEERRLDVSEREKQLLTKKEDLLLAREKNNCFSLSLTSSLLSSLY